MQYLVCRCSVLSNDIKPDFIATRKNLLVINQKVCRSDHIHECMDNIKREKLERACKKEKNHKARTRMIAVRMVRVRNISVEETADIQGRNPNLDVPSQRASREP